MLIIYLRVCSVHQEGEQEAIRSLHRLCLHPIGKLYKENEGQCEKTERQSQTSAQRRRKGVQNTPEVEESGNKEFERCHEKCQKDQELLHHRV